MPAPRSSLPGMAGLGAGCIKACTVCHGTEQDIGDCGDGDRGQWKMFRRGSFSRTTFCFLCNPSKDAGLVITQPRDLHAES